MAEINKSINNTTKTMPKGEERAAGYTRSVGANNPITHNPSEKSHQKCNFSCVFAKKAVPLQPN